MQENYIPINLPSKCLVYEGINPSDISIRTLKGKDELLIAEMNIENFDKKFLLVLKNVLKGIQPEKLTLGDRLYLAIWLTVNSYMKEYPINYECEKCWEKLECIVDLSKLEIISLPDSFKEPYAIKLPKSEETINLRLLRYEDILKIAEMEKQGTNVFLRRFALSIVDDSKSLFDKESYLENLDVKDIAVIRAFHEKFVHGPKMEIGYECPKCGGTGVMPVPFRIDILFPYGKRLERFIGNTI